MSELNLVSVFRTETALITGLFTIIQKHVYFECIKSSFYYSLPFDKTTGILLHRR